MCIKRRYNKYSLSRSRNISGRSYGLKDQRTLNRDHLIISTGNLLFYFQINIETTIIRYKGIYSLIRAVYNQFPHRRR